MAANQLLLNQIMAGGPNPMQMLRDSRKEDALIRGAGLENRLREHQIADAEYKASPEYRQSQAEIAKLDSDYKRANIFSTMSEAQRKEVEHKAGRLGQVSSWVLSLPPEMRANAWDNSMGLLKDEGIDGTPYVGKYSDQNAAMFYKSAISVKDQIDMANKEREFGFRDREVSATERNASTSAAKADLEREQYEQNQRLINSLLPWAGVTTGAPPPQPGMVSVPGVQAPAGAPATALPTGGSPLASAGMPVTTGQTPWQAGQKSPGPIVSAGVQEPTDAPGSAPAIVQQQPGGMDPQQLDRAALAAAAAGNSALATTIRDMRTKPVDMFKDENTLRDEFNKASGDFVKVRDAYSRIKASAENPSAAGDLSLIFNYMKVLDPGSTVREGEFATAQNTTGIPQQILNQYNKVLTGERLAPEQRADFVGQAQNLYAAQEAGHNQLRSEYENLSSRRGLNAKNVVIEYRITGEGSLKPKEGPKDKPAAVGDVIVHGGKRYRITALSADGDHNIEVIP